MILRIRSMNTLACMHVIIQKNVTFFDLTLLYLGIICWLTEGPRNSKVLETFYVATWLLDVYLVPKILSEFNPLF